MNRYLLSVMQGRQKSFLAQVIIYVLLPWSLLYRFGVFCHRNYHWLKGPYKAPKPVISIGNITVGGSGKTPLVIWLAKVLQSKGFKACILTRGYMPQASKFSDEVDMLNEQIPYIPILTGADRAANIRKSKGHIPVDVYIADDAFQHWPLGRDLDIVAIDSVNPFGNGCLLPAGVLREDTEALKRADVFVLTKTEISGNIQALSARLRKLNPRALLVESCYKSTGVVNVFDSVGSMPADFLNNKNVAGFCAIGDPFSFESSLRNTGAVIKGLFNYMDHYVYRSDDIRRMLEFCHSQDVRVLVTTHKDAVKLRVFADLFAGMSLVYIPIQLEITRGCDELIEKIISVCGR